MHMHKINNSNKGQDCQRNNSRCKMNNSKWSRKKQLEVPTRKLDKQSLLRFGQDPLWLHFIALGTPLERHLVGWERKTWKSSHWRRWISDLCACSNFRCLFMMLFVTFHFRFSKQSYLCCGIFDDAEQIGRQIFNVSII